MRGHFVFAIAKSPLKLLDRIAFVTKRDYGVYTLKNVIGFVHRRKAQLCMDSEWMEVVSTK